MKETSKAYRLLEHDPLFNQIHKGRWLDVGAGDDCLLGARPFDKAHGDAHKLEGIEPESLDLVFSSHCLEHLEEPIAAITRWFEVTKPGGWLWIIVPHFQLYEHSTWPSLFNPDHKHAFMAWRHEKDLDNVFYLEDIAETFESIASTERIASRNNGYDMSLINEPIDQTLGEAEASCELVMRKLENT